MTEAERALLLHVARSLADRSMPGGDFQRTVLDLLARIAAEKPKEQG